MERQQRSAQDRISIMPRELEKLLQSIRSEEIDLILDYIDNNSNAIDEIVEYLTELKNILR